MGLNWYVIRAISGKENKIKTYLEREITRNSLEKFIPEVMIPYEKVYVMRNGKKQIKERNYFPGYILLEASLEGEMVHAIRNIPGVSGQIRQVGANETERFTSRFLLYLINTVNRLFIKNIAA